MRLDKSQKKALKTAFLNLTKDDRAYLFGSRVDDEKRGGDIDILIISQQPSFELSRKIMRDFFKVCEEKLDLIIINPLNTTKEQTLFMQSIQKVPLVKL